MKIEVSKTIYNKLSKIRKATGWSSSKVLAFYVVDG
jgi:hypothetical protein